MLCTLLLGLSVHQVPFSLLQREASYISSDAEIFFSVCVCVCIREKCTFGDFLPVAEGVVVHIAFALVLLLPIAFAFHQNRHLSQKSVGSCETHIYSWLKLCNRALESSEQRRTAMTHCLIKESLLLER